MRDGVPLAGSAAQPRRLAVLALLARAGTRGITRDKILACLWPDSEDEQGRRVLTKALSALRRDLGGDDVFLGANDLRLNPDCITSDVGDFEAALAAGQLERAVGLYAGPFLDGFRLSGAPEFEQWAEAERDTLAHSYRGALEKLARSASDSGDPQGAVRWWRILAAQDPLNARYALGLMRALASAKDRHAAIQHARVYEALLEQELDLPADREVIAFAEELRADAAAQRSTTAADSVRAAPAIPDGVRDPSRNADPAAASALARDAPPAAAPRDIPRETVDLPTAEEITNRAGDAVTRDAAPRPRRLAWAVAFGASAVILGSLAIFRWGPLTPRPALRQSAKPVIAIGRIADYREAATVELALPLGDMLATNLARAGDLRVVSTARMYELLYYGGDRTADTTGALMTAARRAGATEMVDGALYELPGGLLRLDLRRIHLANGDVAAAHSVTGTDAFSLADSGTAQLLAQFGVTAQLGSIADVSTRSLAAYRLYEQGLRAFVAGELAAAERLFDAALAEDSTFAMAAYYSSRLAPNMSTMQARLARANQLASKASDRERLIIRAGWARQTNDPALRFLVETLVVRYPDEVEGHLLSGIFAVLDGSFHEAVPHLERAVAMDSLGFRGANVRCVACEALQWQVSAYHLMDSLREAERVALRWTRLQPHAALAWQTLMTTLDQLDRSDDAVAAYRQYAARTSEPQAALITLAMIRIRQEAFEDADRLLRQLTEGSAPGQETEAYWYLALSLRQQGRLTEALDASRRHRSGAGDLSLYTASPAPQAALMEAQVLFELGRYAEAGALFDSIGTASAPPALRSSAVRARLWSLAHASTSRAALGDTTALRQAVDTLQALSPHTSLGSHRRLHHYARALLLTARGDSGTAIAELRRAMYSPTHGYTRVNYELARLHLANGRPRDAVAALAPALRGSIEAANLYVTRTELRELLAHAYEAAGERDSARVQYRRVARAWQHADRPLVARAVRAGQAAARLEAGAARPLP